MRTREQDATMCRQLSYNTRFAQALQTSQQLQKR